MKKKVLVLLVAVLAFNMVNAQDVNIFEDILGKKKKVTATTNGAIKHIVELPGKTALEISNMVEMAIAKHWVNPDEVIAGKVPGKYIKVNGGGPSVQTSILLPSYETKLSYMFKFKDGKFMYTVESKTVFPSSQYSTGGTYASSFVIVKRSGKPSKMNVSAVATINASVNTFIKSIIKPENVSLDSDW
jgi:hypothetical protein